MKSLMAMVVLLPSARTLVNKSPSRGYNQHKARQRPSSRAQRDPLPGSEAISEEVRSEG